MVIDKILEDIRSQGYSIQEGIFPTHSLLNLKNDVLGAYHNNSLKEAGIGRKANLKKNVRGDQIQWLTKENLTSSQKQVWDFLETLKVRMNQNLFLGLTDFETHVTVYPRGTFYKKHIDQFKNFEGSGEGKTRKISFILYLNEEWAKGDGGELRLYNSNDQEIFTVQPQFGRVVIFMSDEFPHEVLETKKERISMTGWFFRS